MIEENRLKRIRFVTKKEKAFKDKNELQTLLDNIGKIGGAAEELV